MPVASTALEPAECTLATASCTTSWIDWIHGELWVCPDGMFRRPLGLGATMAHGSGPTVDTVALPKQRLSSADIAQSTSRRRNYWVTWDSIAGAEFRHGFMTDSLHIRLKDGRRLKFMWLAVDQAHLVLAPALKESIGDGLAPLKGKLEHGQLGREDSGGPTDWPVTVTASWIDPRIDQLELRSAIVVLAAGAWIAGSSLILDGRSEIRILALGLVVGAVVAWRALRNRRSALELILSPETARLREGRGADTRTHELARQRAGWLTAGETGLDWHDRGLGLFDDADRLVAKFKGRPAHMAVRSDSSAGDAWVQANLPRADRTAQDVASVTALVGMWWPHPERRLSIRGNASVRRRWEEPDLAGYAAWDRKQRRLYAAAFGAFMLFFLVIGLVSPMPLSEQIAFLPPVVAGLVFAAYQMFR